MPAKGFYPEMAIRVFQPMLQVDHFAWPRVCRRLDGLYLWNSTGGETLLAAGKQGKKVLGISRDQRGSVQLLCCDGAARRLVTRNIKTVIVDADLREPQSGLLPQLGWEHVAAGSQPVEDVLIGIHRR